MTTSPAARPTPQSLTARAASERRAWVEPHMGMPVSIHLRGDGAFSPSAERAVRAAFEFFREMDELFSTYRPQSQLRRLRRKEIGLAGCSTLLARALTIGEHAERVTQGAFTTLLPTGDGDRAFDPTGLVKGWTVDLASDHLSVLPGVSWAIALTEGAVATSGNAARGAHLYDPASEWMVDRAGSVTVTGPTLLWADVWATALFVGGLPTREAFDARAVGYAAFAL